MVDVLPINFWVLVWASFFIAKNLCSFRSLVVFPAWSQGVNDWSSIWLINQSKAAQIFRNIALWNRCFKWILSAVARTSSRGIVSYCTWSIWHAHRCSAGLLLRLPYPLWLPNNSQTTSLWWATQTMQSLQANHSKSIHFFKHQLWSLLCASQPFVWK